MSKFNQKIPLSLVTIEILKGLNIKFYKRIDLVYGQKEDAYTKLIFISPKTKNMSF